MYYLRQLRAFLRLRWVPVLVFVAGTGLLFAGGFHRSLAFQRDPGFSFDEMLTLMAGVLTSIVVTTFSAVFVALTLASAQFSPRIVRGFFREDWRVQLVLMLYVLGIAWCFLLKYLGLTRLDSTFTLAGTTFHHSELAILYGVLLILLVFPYFVYYIIRNINAARITYNIARRTIREIEAHYRHRWTLLDADTFHSPTPPDPDTHIQVLANDHGYLDHHNTLLLKLVRMSGHEVYLRKHVGGFVSKGSLVAVIDLPAPGGIKGRILRRLVQQAIVVREYRSYTQDLNFGVRQLVDIAIKAISPAVNDPTTAVTCLNYLGEIVKVFGQYRVPSRGTGRLEAQGIHVAEPDFERVVDQAFNQIHQWGRTDHIVVRQIVHVVTEVIATTRNPHNLAILIKEVEDMELLEKSEAEMKALFVFNEFVSSLRAHYLRRFVEVAIAAIDAIAQDIAALPAGQREQAEKLHAGSMAVLAGMRGRLEGFRG